MNDPVNKPKHYRKHPSGVECISINENFTANLAAAFKYVWRFEDKEKPLEDLQKSIWYLKREMGRYKGVILNGGKYTTPFVASTRLKNRMTKVLQCESGHKYNALLLIWDTHNGIKPAENMYDAMLHIEYLIQGLE